MSRLLALLLALLVVLVLADRLFTAHRRAERLRAGTVRPLTDLPRAAVGQVRLGLGPGTWVYRLVGGVWRCPEHHRAFASGEQLGMLLAGLLEAGCTPVSAEPGDLSRYGLEPRRALRVTLADPGGRVLVEVRVGRGVPAPTSPEAYVLRAGSDTVFHLHANPHLAVGEGPYPMLDPHVLPRALHSRPLAAFGFGGGPGGPQVLRRSADRDPVASLARPGGPESAQIWTVVVDGRERRCAAASAAAYAGFVARLRYEALQTPEGFAPGSAPRWLRLVDEEGQADTLDVGGTDARGSVYLRHRRAGQVCTVPAAAAALLFPSVAVLLDSVDGPARYASRPPVDTPSAVSRIQ
ncbi:MAG: DUF4340 domain-containing protein [Candidatus Latescibacterota bacterium]